MKLFVFAKKNRFRREITDCKFKLFANVNKFLIIFFILICYK